MAVIVTRIRGNLRLSIAPINLENLVVRIRRTDKETHTQTLNVN